MSILHLTVLALVQGVTEFLPISSQAHLILVPVVTDWEDQGQLLDIAVHVGTLAAVLLYFRHEVWGMAVGLVHLAGGHSDPRARLAGLVVLGTIPVVVAGFAMHSLIPGGLRSAELIGWTTIGFGLALYAADRMGLTIRRLQHLKLSDAVVIGIAQTLALIPGVSRSGATMTAARMMGFERVDAARFSLLLSIPAIAGAGLLGGIDLARSGDLTLAADAVIAAVLAFFTALAAIALLLRWLRHASFTPFVIYRLALGGLILAWVYG